MEDRTVYTIRRLSDLELTVDVDSMKKARSLEDVLDEIGMGFFQYRLLAICGLAFMADSMEINLLGYLSQCAGQSFDLDNAKKASISGVVFVGQLFGSLLWGRIGDRYGRRAAFLMSASTTSLFGFLTGIGGVIIPFDIIAEFMPVSYRGQFLVLIEYFWTLGSILVAGLAWALLSSSSWRVLAVLTAFPVTLSLLLGVFCLPESVRWLVSRKKTEQAEQVLNNIAALNGVRLDPFKLSYEMEFVQNVSSSPSSLFTPQSSWLDLVSSKYMLRRTIPLWLIWATFAFSYNGVVLYVNRVYSTSSSSTTSCSFEYKDIFVNSTSEIVGLLLTNFLIDWIGRTQVQTILYFCAGATFIIIGAAGTANSALLFATLYFGRLFLMGASSATWVITPELYPTRLRTTGHSVCNSIARLFAFTCPYAVYSSLSNAEICTCFAILSATAAFASMMLPETRSRKLDADDNEYCKESLITPILGSTN